MLQRENSITTLLTTTQQQQQQKQQYVEHGNIAAWIDNGGAQQRERCEEDCVGKRAANSRRLNLKRQQQ
jgi:hypothetical protein